jgi:phage gpG-like protein
MVRLRIQLTDQAVKIIRRYASFPDRIAPAVMAAMDAQNQLTIGQMVRKRLSFPRSQPPTPEGLRVITNTLRKSILAEPARLRDGASDALAVVSSIGSSVKYAAIHEFGATVQVPERQRRAPRRVQTSGQKRAISVPAAIRAGILTRSGKVRKGDRHTSILAGGMIRVRAHQAKYPARAFVRRTLDERRDAYGRAISAAIVAAAKRESPPSPE